MASNKLTPVQFRDYLKILIEEEFKRRSEEQSMNTSPRAARLHGLNDNNEDQYENAISEGIRDALLEEEKKRLER